MPLSSVTRDIVGQNYKKYIYVICIYRYRYRYLGKCMSYNWQIGGLVIARRA